MYLREANQNDIPQILEVLRASLGETSSKKTEEIWRYKHIDNPFGESLVLVAEEDGVVIGVRAFMKWRWQKGKESFYAFRAVDTATHPDHQGKGVFKKLTLKALEIGQQRGGHFVFNTPNNQSKPGYLKMGWKEVSKLYTSLIPVLPFYWNSRNSIPYKKEIEDDTENLLTWWNINMRNSSKLFTPKTRDYLEWRYSKNPLQEYRIKASKTYYISAYVKKQNKFKELRISELILIDKSSEDECRKIIYKWAKDYGVHFISLNLPLKKKLFVFQFSGFFGPDLTYKNLNNDEDHNNFLKLDKWAYSLGDLELF
jgi:GNAT superfamily N-acetyltransferase/predicted hydrocarbon binding protein